MADMHLHTAFKIGGRVLAPSQRIGNAPIAAGPALPPRPTIGSSTFESGLVGRPMTLTNPPVLTPAILRHNATTSHVFHV